MDPNDIILERETQGWHRFIAYETGIVPTSVYWEGPRGGDREGQSLVIEVKSSSLKAEPMRYPPPRDQYDERTPEQRARERFPEWRDYDLSESDFAAQLDEFVFVPFRVIARPD